MLMMLMTLMMSWPLPSRGPWITFRKHLWPQAIRASSLRQRCVDSMKKINDSESIVWEGMSFNTLAMAMSSHQDTTLGAYVDRLARNGEWLDASASHALACSFKADLMVWQPAVEPAMLGHSCVAGAASSAVMLHVAPVNDLGLGLPQKRTHELVDDIEMHASSSDGNHESVPGKD